MNIKRVERIYSEHDQALLDRQQQMIKETQDGIINSLRNLGREPTIKEITNARELMMREVNFILHNFPVHNLVVPKITIYLEDDE